MTMIDSSLFVFLIKCTCTCVVSGQEKETEAVKLMSIKAGLLDHSRAWMTFGKKCCMFAEVQKVSLKYPKYHMKLDVSICSILWY